jgi:hypothetical protein
VLPGVAPAGRDHRVALAPAAAERLERLCARVGVDRRVDRLQIVGDLPPALVGDKAQAVADQVDDGPLHLGLREDGLDRLRQALESVDAADQNVPDAVLLQLASHLQPELGALQGLEPKANHVPLAVEVDAGRHAAGAVRTAPPSRTSTISASRNRIG